MIQMGVDVNGESFIFCLQDSIPDDGGGEGEGGRI